MITWSEVETLIHEKINAHCPLENKELLEFIVEWFLIDVSFNQHEMEKQRQKIQLDLEKAVVLNSNCSTLLKFLGKKRLEKAKEILCKKRSVKLAAFSSGFSDLSNFSKKFKQSYHFTPREFLKLQEKQSEISAIE